MTVSFSKFEKKQALAGFTLVEMLVAMSIFSGVTVALLTFGQTSMRLVMRNLSTNHSHEAARIAELQMLKDFHEAASPFRLFTFDGSTYADSTPTATTDQEPLSQQFVSSRANGVRFRKLGGGPYQLKANTVPSTTSLTFDFGVSGALPYVPVIGDKVVFPLVSREFAITAVTTTPTSGSTQGTVTIAATGGFGFTIDATTAGKVTTGYFYREVAYSAWAEQLRYHSNFTGTSKPTFKVIRDRISSPQPFALLFPTSTGPVDNLALRVSLETYDPDYTSKNLSNGTATLQTIIPPLVMPTSISATDSY